MIGVEYKGGDDSHWISHQERSSTMPVMLCLEDGFSAPKDCSSATFRC